MMLIYTYKNGLGPNHSTDRVGSISARHHMVNSQDNKGFSLIELIMVMAIIGILSQMAIIAVPTIRNFIGKTKSQAEIRLIEKDIVAYMVDKGVLPNSLNEIGRAVFSKQNKRYWMPATKSGNCPRYMPSNDLIRTEVQFRWVVLNLPAKEPHLNFMKHLMVP